MSTYQSIIHFIQIPLGLLTTAEYVGSGKQAGNACNCQSLQGILTVSSQLLHQDCSTNWPYPQCRRVYLVDKALVVSVIAVCHDLDIIALPEKCWEVLRSIVLCLDSLIIL